MTSDSGITITWLGHAACKLELPDHRVILIDPWLNNPSAPPNSADLERVDLMLISHGHSDNMGDAVEIGRRFQPRVIAMNELCAYLSQKGLNNCTGGNTGGTQEWEGVRVTMVEAVHSSSVEDEGKLMYTGLAVGFVIHFDTAFTVYHAGDTAIFPGMQLIGRLYDPDLAILPIGDHFTMGPREAAEAIRLLDVDRVLPIHYGTFPLFTGTPEALRREARDLKALRVIDLKPGESVTQTEVMRG